MKKRNKEENKEGEGINFIDIGNFILNFNINKVE